MLNRYRKPTKHVYQKRLSRNNTRKRTPIRHSKPKSQSKTILLIVSSAIIILIFAILMFSQIKTGNSNNTTLLDSIKLDSINDVMLRLYDNGFIERFRLANKMIYKKYMDKYVNRKQLISIIDEDFSTLPGNTLKLMYWQGHWHENREVKLGYTLHWKLSDGEIYLWGHDNNNSEFMYIDYIYISKY